MVIFPYFGPMGKLKYQFSLSVSTQFDFYQNQSGEHVESYNVIWKTIKKSLIFTELPCSSHSASSSSFPIELMKRKNRIMKIGMYKGFIFRMRTVLLYFR